MCWLEGGWCKCYLTHTPEQLGRHLWVWSLIDCFPDITMVSGSYETFPISHIQKSCRRELRETSASKQQGVTCERKIYALLISQIVLWYQRSLLSLRNCPTLALWFKALQLNTRLTPRGYMCRLIVRCFYLCRAFVGRVYLYLIQQPHHLTFRDIWG